MKRIALVLVMIVMGTVLFAQAKEKQKKDDGIRTLIGQNQITHGWVTGLQSVYTQLKGHDAWIGGTKPGIHVDLNVVKWLRMNAGLAYQYVPDLNMKDIRPNMLNNLTATIGLKFGKF